MAGAHGGSFSLKPPVALPAHEIKVLLLVSFAFLIAGYDIQLLGLVLPYVSADFGVKPGDEGEIIMWARVGVLVAFPLAMLADRLGRRTLLLITILGSAITTLATAFAQNETQFVVLQASVRTFGYAQDMISIVVIAEEIADQARGWALGLLAASAAFGGGLSAIIFTLIEVLPFGWRALYVIGAVPIFIIAWAWRSMPETRRFEELKAQRDSVAATSGLSAALASFRALAVTHGRRFWALIGLTFPLAFGLTCAMVLLPTFLKSDLQLAPHWVSAIFVGGGLFGLFGNFLAGRYADRHGRKPVFLFASLLFIAAMGTLYLGPHNPFLIAVMWGFGVFCFFALEVVVGAWSAELFPTENRSTASGARLATNIIGGGAALLLNSYLYGMLGGRAESIAVLLPVILLATLIAMLAIPETAGKTLEQIAGSEKH
jgi:putative MFS transporter